MTMRDCRDGAIRDVLPDMVSGTLSPEERARVEAHVITCADCAAECRLLRDVIAAYPAPAMDIARIAAAIPSPARISAFRAARWRAAAAIVVVVLGSVSLVVLGGTSRRESAGSPMLDSARSGLNDSAASTVSVHGGLGDSGLAGAVEQTGLGFGGGLSELTEEQLTTLLVDVDALEASPSAEPDVHAISIVPANEGGNNGW